MWTDIFGEAGRMVWDDKSKERIELTPRLRFVLRDGKRILQQKVWKQQGATSHYWDWVDVPEELE